MERRQIRGHRQGQCNQQHRASLDQKTFRAQGRGLQQILFSPLSYGRGASLPHPPQRGLPFHPHRHPLLPENQGPDGNQPQQNPALLQPDVRD